MSEETKNITLTDDELTKLKQLERAYISVYHDIGRTNVEKHETNRTLQSIEKRIKSLMEKYLKLKEQEMELVQNLIEVYGPGEIDTNDGTFIPKSTQ